MAKTAANLLKEHKLRKEFLEIGIIVCERCWGNGEKYHIPGLKTTEECEACDGTGGTKVGVVNE